MPLRVIELDPADTFYSMRDRLLHGGRGRAVLVLPTGVAPVGAIDLVLLRRLADRERLDVGLVTADRTLARQARALGLPAFSSVTLAEHFRPGWWRSRGRSEQVGFAPGADHRSPKRIAAEEAADPAFARGRSLRLVALILITALILGLIAVSAIYALPYTTVTLRPEAQPAQVIVDLTADPTLTEAMDRAVPALALNFAQSWEATGSNTGDAVADRQRIRASALQGLGSAAPGILAARLDPGQLLVPSSIRFDVIDESFDQAHDVSTLMLHAELEGLAVDAADVNRQAYRELTGVLPNGFVLDPSSLRVKVETSIGGPSDQLQITAGATGRAEIEPSALAETLRGQRLEDVRRYFEGELPAEATFNVSPEWWREWFGRLPLRADRIHIELLP